MQLSKLKMCLCGFDPFGPHRRLYFVQ